MMRRPFICCSPSLPHARPPMLCLHISPTFRPLSARFCPHGRRWTAGRMPRPKQLSLQRPPAANQFSPFRPIIPTGHKKVFPIPGGHKKSVLFQGRFPAVWTGLEPATPCVTGRYSNQLNYHTVLICECKSTNFFRFSKLFTIFSADDLLPPSWSYPTCRGRPGAPLSATSRNCNTGALPPKTRPPAMRRPSKPSSDIPPVERHGTHTHLSDSAHYAGATRGH